MHHGTYEEQLVARKPIDLEAYLCEAIDELKDKLREIGEEMTEQMGSDDYICTVVGKFELHCWKKGDRWEFELMVGSESVWEFELFEKEQF